MLYTIARQLGYKLEFVEPKTLEEYLKAIQNQEYDIFAYLDERIENINYEIIALNKPAYNAVVRYSNLADSAKWEIINKPEDLNGDVLACLKGYSFEYLYNERFPESEIK